MKLLLSIFLTIISFISFAQKKTDTTKILKGVVIRPYFSRQPVIRSTGSFGIVDSVVLQRQQGSSLVSAANSVPGIRMEERSPGSYRLSIRGSLLRSPFGIRNIKIYIDDFPLTDAGGNTYLNAIDVSGIQSMQFLKGPQSSIYGANSGGVVLISPQSLTSAQDSGLCINLQGGSFGLFKESISFGQSWGKYQFNVTQAYQRSDGYREHSNMERKYIQTFHKYDYAPTLNLKALVFYSDLFYQTPGGLNAAQFEFNPRLSRAAAGIFKSAIDQHAGIYSKTLYGGISNEWKVTKDFKHVISLFGAYTDFKNPFISNYEFRKENTLGMRTYIEYGKKLTALKWSADLGMESSNTGTDFNNFDNIQGTPGNIQASDKIKALSNFAFAHINFDFFDRLLVELSSSINLYKYRYEQLAPTVIGKKTNEFDAQLMPRLAVSYLLSNNLSARSSVSKGYSPPTLEEVRASDKIINVDLQPEQGWNYETGLKYQSLNQRLSADINGFYYHLKNAIVRRLNEDDTDYFINAGGTKQWGAETTVSLWVVPMRSAGVLRGLKLNNAYTLSKFKFKDYVDRSSDYSGNELTGVPKNVIVSSADLTLKKGYYLFLQHNYTSKIPLNDGNTVYANSYHLIQAKLGIRYVKIANASVELFAGADNILNKRYSLGNDLNAIGGRFFNPAATRNFYGGLTVRL